MRRKWLFIVNPVSGTGTGKHLPRSLHRLACYDNVDYTIRFTTRAGHATELAARAGAEGFTHVVAVGGDGTVNEVGSALLGTDIVMGIIPRGSGNGFARHLGLSTRMHQALRQLIEGEEARVDALDINGRCSLNVSGVGFDAEVARLFAQMKRRGFLSYARASALLWFRYGERRYTFRCGEQEWEERCLIVSVANSARYGYNFFIAPAASVQDGLLDICILKRPKLYQVPAYLYRALTRGLDKLSCFREIQCEEVIIDGDLSSGHLDGDPCTFEAPARVKVLPGALRVVMPRAH
ncbi:MAG: diacylglycerol kinase family lipid kinase [Odoribacteraceae bacterium]|jgi:YegS/Rv2252/BmrU family lipid kinase|nr:diacylglycerol kinase family lipid kinase [Odoribacteraceae bacterium]